MTDYDVWLVHDYWTWHTAFHATDEEEVWDLIPMRLSEEGLPRWIVTDAKDIKIQKAGEFA